MIRKAFTMKLNPGQKEEYKRRHDELWPEVASMLKDSGVSDYSIFLDESSNTLFGIMKLSEDNKADLLARQDIVKKWWAYMKDIMETNPDNSPVEEPLLEMFHLD